MTLSFARLERLGRAAARVQLRRREFSELSFVELVALTGGPIVLDTCVYIDQIQNKTPMVVDDLVKARIVNHAATAIQELMHTVGVLDPKDPRSKGVIERIQRVVDAMPNHRLLTPDLETLATAALYAGILCRIQGYGKPERMRALNDCVLFFQARKLGLTVLTRNVADFDLLQQLQPKGRVLFYRVRDDR